jgi:hypothetical protein
MLLLNRPLSQDGVSGEELFVRCRIKLKAVNFPCVHRRLGWTDRASRRRVRHKADLGMKRTTQGNGISVQVSMRPDRLGTLKDEAIRADRHRSLHTAIERPVHALYARLMGHQEISREDGQTNFCKRINKPLPDELGKS